MPRTLFYYFLTILTFPLALLVVSYPRYAILILVQLSERMFNYYQRVCQRVCTYYMSPPYTFLFIQINHIKYRNEIHFHRVTSEAACYIKPVITLQVLSNNMIRYRWSLLTTSILIRYMVFPSHCNCRNKADLPLPLPSSERKLI